MGLFMVKNTINKLKFPLPAAHQSYRVTDGIQHWEHKYYHKIASRYDLSLLASKTMAEAKRQAKSQGCSTIEPEHILVGLLKEKHGLASKTLERLKIDTAMLTGAACALVKQPRVGIFGRIFDRSLRVLSKSLDIIENEHVPWFLAGARYLRRSPKPNFRNLILKAKQYQENHDDEVIDTLHLLLAYASTSLYGRFLFKSISLSRDAIWETSRLVIGEEGQEYVKPMLLFSKVKPLDMSLYARIAMMEAGGIAYSHQQVAVQPEALMVALLLDDRSTVVEKIFQTMKVDRKIIRGSLVGFIQNRPKTYGSPLVDAWYDETEDFKRRGYGFISRIMGWIGAVWSNKARTPPQSNLDSLLVYADKYRVELGHTEISELHMIMAFTKDKRCGRKLLKALKIDRFYVLDAWKRSVGQGF